MESKNYVFRENVTDLQYFCQLQVSNKFLHTMTPQEAELIGWMVDSFVHRNASEDEVTSVVKRITSRVEGMNELHENNGPYLVVTYSPLRPTENGFIRIERTSGRHQSILLPVIDYRGEVILK